MSRMSPEAHASLFRSPKSSEAGAVTDRVANGLPVPSRATPLKLRNLTDEQILGRMRHDGIPHAPLATALADRAPGKRTRLVDKLIGRPGFGDKWSYFYLDLVHANGKMQRGVELFHRMLKDSLAADRPYDDFVRSLIASPAKSNYLVPAVHLIVREHVEGKTGIAPENGEDFAKINQTYTHDEVSILFGKISLGIDLSCIGCHNRAGYVESTQYSWDDREPTAKDARFGSQNPDIVSGNRNRHDFGLCGMIENVWEWTADGYAQKYCEMSPGRNSPGLPDGKYRVLRGGSWFDQAGSLMFLTCSYRSWARPNERSETIGFRCARSAR